MPQNCATLDQKFRPCNKASAAIAEGFLNKLFESGPPGQSESPLGVTQGHVSRTLSFCPFCGTDLRVSASALSTAPTPLRWKQVELVVSAIERYAPDGVKAGNYLPFSVSTVKVPLRIRIFKRLVLGEPKYSLMVYSEDMPNALLCYSLTLASPDIRQEHSSITLDDYFKVSRQHQDRPNIHDMLTTHLRWVPDLDLKVLQCALDELPLFVPGNPRQP